MRIDELSQEQRKALSKNVLRLLAELWLDQNGMEGSVTIVEKQAEEQPKHKEE